MAFNSAANYKKVKKKKKTSNVYETFVLNENQSEPLRGKTWGEHIHVNQWLIKLIYPQYGSGIYSGFAKNGRKYSIW